MRKVKGDFLRADWTRECIVEVLLSLKMRELSRDILGDL